MSQKIATEIINKMQRNYDKAKYPKKLPGDKLICQLCGGKYRRYCKSDHYRTKKHIMRTSKFVEIINGIFIIPN